MTKKNIELGIYISALILAIAVFLPLTKLPVYGEVSYNRIADIESYIVIFFALSAIVLLFSNKPKLVIFSAAGVWVTLLFPAIMALFEKENNTVLGKIGRNVSNALQNFAADIFLNVAGFTWGGFIFLLALLGFTVCCVLRFIKK